nr:hypothetical protein [Tanacetum cinerariifolium]
MNSLYGRFGINPLSSKTLIGHENDLKRVVLMEHFQDAELLGEDTFVMSYKENIGVSPLDQWKPPNTDSVVLSQPLPEELISSSILGMLKLEDQIVKGFFLAPKAYSYYTLEGSTVKKYKGPAKDKVKVDAKFRIDWESLEIKNQEIIFSLGLKEGSKRLPVYDSNKNWVDTKSIAIHDLSNIDYISRKVISSLSDRVLHLENERLNEKLEERNREIAKLKSQIEVQTGVTNQTLVEKKIDMKTKADEEKQKTDEEKPNTDVKNKD